MALFLSAAEAAAIRAGCGEAPLSRYYWALLNRAARRAAEPGLRDAAATGEWYHFGAEYLTDGALAWALKPDDRLAAWVREVALSFARRPLDDWVGPWFRDHSEPARGHLETAHLSWSLAVALDLAAPLFDAAEAAELRDSLAQRAILLCRRWLERDRRLMNWRCVLNAGVAVAAAVLDDAASLSLAKAEFDLDCQAFQPDGSYGESLQYGNYAAFSLMLTAEALLRSGRYSLEQVNPAAYVGYARWAAHSLFYVKPLQGWGQQPRPRSANFNDSAAIHAPSPDLLLHLATRCRQSHPTEAALARWLVDTVYEPVVGQGPQHRATFGFVNRFGFLTMPLLTSAASGQSPQELGEPELATFSCGDVLARDGWSGQTVLAVHGGGDALHAAAHLHGDLNSFILVHRRERLLVDPGHSCYRGLLHDLELGTATHNTCTFEIPSDGTADGGPGMGARWPAGHRGQSTVGHRDLVGGVLAPPVERGARRLLAERVGPVAVIGSEAAALYGPPLREFSRFWLLCASHVLFIVDRVRAEVPVRTRFNWLLNDRDAELELKLAPPDRLVARRGDAGLKLFHLAGGRLGTLRHGFVHDAYHPLPGQLGEGRSGSGVLLHWETAAAAAGLAVHAMAFDDYGAIAGWHLVSRDGAPALEAPGQQQCWRLDAGDGCSLTLSELVGGFSLRLVEDQSGWQLEA